MSESVETSWTIQKLLQWTTQHFSTKGIASSRLDSELLLSHILNCKRLDLYLRFDQPLGATELKAFKELVVRRSKQEPIAYILGKQEFYGRNFIVSKDVLIPRPETEHVVDEALKFMKSKGNVKFDILDIGCGSGAIGLTLAKENTNVSLTAVDISQTACEVTKANAQILEVENRIRVLEMPFLEYKAQEEHHFDLIVSNPPYISLKAKGELPKDVVQFEPAQALFGGSNGDEILTQWIPSVITLLKSGALFLCEFGYDQGNIVKKVAEKEPELEKIEILKDYSGHSRILKAQKV